MLAAVAERADPAYPLECLRVRDWPAADPPDGWARVTVRAASLNHHDLWTLRGVGVPPERFPLVLGSDASGVDDDGREVIVHGVLGAGAEDEDETLASDRRLLGEESDGTLAETVCVPRANLVAKPAGLTFAEAACLPGAWLTAYRMLFEKASLEPGATVLVQGAGGGVATALVALGSAAGHRMWVTSASEEKRGLALKLGADRAFGPGERLPERADAVMETVGRATWRHSLGAVRPGGRIVVAGATSGWHADIDLRHLFFRQITVTGVVMGTRGQLARLAGLCERTGVRPAIDRVIGLDGIHEGLESMASGSLFGKIVVAME